MARRQRKMGAKNSSTVGVDLNRLSQELRGIILEEGMQIIGDLAELVAQDANRLAPTIQGEYSPAAMKKNKRGGDNKSGPIKGNIFAERSNTLPGTWVVCSPTWYSHFMEYGTMPHEMPSADKQEALKQGKGKKMKFKGTNGFPDPTFASWVFHPQVSPRPFLRPAADKADYFLQVVLNRRYGS